MEIFKKPEEEQKNAEKGTAESCEKPEENKNETILFTLEALEGEEQSLLAEKSQLMDMEETLKQRIKDEIEIKKHKIETLKYEIPELKQRCKALAKILDVPVQK